MEEKMIIEIEYNINGIGVINSNLYPLSQKLFSNSKLGIENRLKNTNQLGSIRYIHNGAHYNRFEYVLLQMTILYVIKQNSEIGLSSNFNFKKNWGMVLTDYQSQYKISGAEIMQCIFICTNLGHFKETFAANKVWFNLLSRDTNGIRKAMRSGLSKESKQIFDNLLNNYDYQRLHLLNSLFILNRNQNTKIHLAIFEKFVELSINSTTLDKWVDLYSKIRTVSYIVLDSHFSYIPIDVDLQNLLFNQKLFIDEILKQNSTLFAVLDRLNDLLEDTLYLENNALLMGTYRSIEIEKDLLDYFSSLETQNGILKVSNITDLLLNTQNSPLFKSSDINSRGIPWDVNKNLSITYNIFDRDKYPTDVFEKEKLVRKKMGASCHIAFNFNPTYTKYRTVFAIDKNLSSVLTIKKCIKIISYALNEYLDLKDYCNEVINNGKMREVVSKKLLTFIFRNLFSKDLFCEFEYNKRKSPFFIGKGTKAVAYQLSLYIQQCEQEKLFNKDTIHEIKSLYSRLNNIEYRGLIIVYAGSLKFIGADKSTKCEVDGIILMPGRKRGQLNIIEAKNYSSRSRRISEAEKQLEKMFIPLIKPELKSLFVKNVINNSGAYLELKLS